MTRSRAVAWVDLRPTRRGPRVPGAPAEWTLRLTLNNRSPQYEVIEPVVGPSIHADRLEERGEGFHHVGYVGDGAAVYYDTATSLGFLVEAVEPPVRMPPTDFGM
jgi:hypothetical protein